MQFQLAIPRLPFKFLWEILSLGCATKTVLVTLLLLLILNNACAVVAPNIDQSLRTKALEGDAQSQYEIGEQYHDAFNSSWDAQPLREESAVWYEMAANQGHAEAQYKLSTFYFSKDYGKSYYWAEQAAVQGHSGAQYSLGMKYAQAWGTQQDLVQAYKWMALSYRGEGGLQELFRQMDRHINLFNPKWILDVGKISSSQSTLEWIIYKGKMSQEQITEGRRLAIEEEDKYGARSIKLNQ